MDTTMKHFSIEDRKLEEVEEIAEREGRKDYDVMREALAMYLRARETENKVHPEVPQDGVVRPQDRAIKLSFNEMWAEEGDIQNPDHGDVIRAIEDGGSYFTYYKFIWMDEYFVCQQVVPMAYDLLDELKTRTNKFRV